MIIREANKADLPDVARTIVDTWRSAYRGIIADDYLNNMSYEQKAERIGSTLNENGIFLLVAQTETGNIIGQASGGPERNGNPIYKGEIYALYVLKNYQREGVGRKLVAAAVQNLLAQGFTSMLIWTLAEGYACKFYEAIGGEIVDRQTIELAGHKSQLVAYGWRDITTADIRR